MIRLFRPILLTCVFGVGATGLACVLADPVPELQKPVRRAPAIVKTGLFPDPTVPLTQLPAQFEIRIRVPDPGETVHYGFFVGGINGASTQFTRETAPLAGSADAPDLIYFTRATDAINGLQPAIDRCLRIDFLVSLDPIPPLPRLDPALGDSVGWWYAPDGTGTCSLFDASVLDSPIDEGIADAGDAG